MTAPVVERVATAEPLGPYLVIQRDAVAGADAEMHSAPVRGNVHAPDKAVKKPRKATVLAVGPGPRDHSGKHIDMGVAVGDRILTLRHADVDMVLGDKPAQGVSVDAVLAVEDKSIPCGYRPLGARVIIRRFAPEAVSPGGIRKPDQALDDRRLAEVLAVGPGAVSALGARIPPDVKPGDLCLMVKWTGVPLEETDDPLVLLVHELDCMVRVTV